MTKGRTIDQCRRNTAKRLRQNATDAEARLWRHLKRLKMKGTHFRRQIPIDKYVVDFACPAAHLVVEVDGSQHGEDEGRRDDETRTQWLASEGYRVLRLWNNDVTHNIHGVMEAIYAAVYGSPAAEPQPLKHTRHRRFTCKDVTPPRRASRADPPPPGEGEGNA